MLDLIPVIFSATDDQAGIRIDGEQLAFRIFLRFESNQSVKLFLGLFQQKTSRKSSVLIKSRMIPYKIKTLVTVRFRHVSLKAMFGRYYRYCLERRSKKTFLLAAFHNPNPPKLDLHIK